MSDLLDIDGLAPEKRARVGRAHDDILGPAERDVQVRRGPSRRRVHATRGRPPSTSPPPTPSPPPAAQASDAGRSARGTLLNAGMSDRGEPLADTLVAQAFKLDSLFTADPQAVIAAVLEA